ncbi:MAG TPA: hypothetical protein PK504_01075 [Ferruginibacter sp.]|nr:hypothetical protein [Ferruginibacter sp.]HRE62965.1 hypothetical protein [Ferruginibacter sp.]
MDSAGTAVQLYKLQLIIYGVTATSCKARLLNTSKGPVDNNITLNIICFGK